MRTGAQTLGRLAGSRTNSGISGAKTVGFLPLTEAAPRYSAEENWRLEKISQGLAEADREEFVDDAEIEAEMRGIIADARARRDGRRQ